MDSVFSIQFSIVVGSISVDRVNEEHFHNSNILDLKSAALNVFVSATLAFHHPESSTKPLHIKYHSK